MKNKQAITSKMPTFLNKEEVQAIIESIHHPVVRYAVIMMVYTGLRVSECIQLTLNDVDFSSGYVYVQKGKGDKKRRVPMHKDVSEALILYLKNHRPKSDSSYFFATKRSGTISNQYINRLLQQAAKKAGIHKRISSHDMRRAFASYLSDKNINVKTIQMLLGHENLKTTSLYIFTKEESMEEAIASIDF